MNPLPNRSAIYSGMGLAVFACLIWSGNFIVARGVIHQIPPVSLAFFRWLCASLILTPIAWKSFRSEWKLAKSRLLLLGSAALFGIAIFNTLLYVAGHYSPAINLALLGTTSSPVMSIILAAIFLKERIRPWRILGMTICIAGILLLLSKGSWHNLRSFHFAAGDGWILLAALCFAIYNIFVRKRPAGISPNNFLFMVFSGGTLLLAPAYLIEHHAGPVVHWSWGLFLIIVYLGLGTSVVAYMCWNAAISRLGAGRTALFGNLIPVFSSLEAVWILQENFRMIHFISALLVIGGLVIANLRISSGT